MPKKEKIKKSRKIEVLIIKRPRQENKSLHLVEQR